jgi:NAD-dependent deacetylase
MLTIADQEAIERVAAMLRPGHRLLFITGAGLSADSGLPTYRGVGGLYSDGLPTRHGMAIEEVLSGPVMKRRPDLTWEYLHQLERASRGARPNRGHEVIAEMERHFAGVWTLTQNVDGLHRRAGSRNLVDIHGDLHELVCTGCARRESVDDYDHLAPLPRCPACREIVRPDVVLFEEMLPKAKLATLNRELDRGFDVVFSVGTSSLFHYILGPVLEAKDDGIPTVEINPGQTDVSGEVDIKIAAGAAEALDDLWTRYRARGLPPDGAHSHAGQEG